MQIHYSLGLVPLLANRSRRVPVVVVVAVAVAVAVGCGDDVAPPWSPNALMTSIRLTHTFLVRIYIWLN